MQAVRMQFERRSSTHTPSVLRTKPVTVPEIESRPVLLPEYEKDKDFTAREIAQILSTIEDLREEIKSLRVVITGDIGITMERAAKLYTHLQTVEKLTTKEAGKILNVSNRETVKRAMEKCAELYKAKIVKSERGRLFLVLKEDY